MNPRPCALENQHPLNQGLVPRHETLVVQSVVKNLNSTARQTNRPPSPPTRHAPNSEPHPLPGSGGKGPSRCGATHRSRCGYDPRLAPRPRGGRQGGDNGGSPQKQCAAPPGYDSAQAERIELSRQACQRAVRLSQGAREISEGPMRLVFEVLSTFSLLAYIGRAVVVQQKHPNPELSNPSCFFAPKP